MGSSSSKGELAEMYLEQAGTPFVAFDRDARVQIANAAACRLLGRPASEVVGADWIEVAVPELRRAASRSALRAVLAGARDVEAQYEHELVTASGDCRLVQWRDVLTRDEAGEITGVLKSGLDITERRAIESEARQAATDLEILREISHAVATREDARDDIVAGVLRLTGGAIASLIEPTTAGDALRVTATTSSLVTDSVVPLADATSGAVIAFSTGRAYFVPQFSANLAISPRLRTTRLSSAIFQPVMVAGQPAGVLVVAWEEAIDALGARSTYLLEVGAHEAAIALERAAGTDRLRTAALTDSLTGVANRRAFDAQLAETLARARQGRRPVSLALIDLNAFKELNDRDGHEAGDRLLQHAAVAWQHELRPSDLLARLGGDEFAIILRDCGARNGVRIAARLRKALDHPAGCGVGVVLWDGEEDPAALIRRADKALYADKASSGSVRLLDAARLSAVADTGVTAETHDEVLDDLSNLVTRLLDVPVGYVSLIGADGQIIASATGLDELAELRQTPLSHSFCQYTVAMGRPLVIADALTEPIVADNPSLEEFGVVAYAGVPLIDEHGMALGSICAMDVKRHDWSSDDVTVLTRLAEIATRRLVALQLRGRSLPGAARAA
jgi:diguanylate cyclase (GGDEF)-like protein/PAS domain S-box-containing protein